MNPKGKSLCTEGTYILFIGNKEKQQCATVLTDYSKKTKEGERKC